MSRRSSTLRKTAQPPSSPTLTRVDTATRAAPIVRARPALVQILAHSFVLCAICFAVYANGFGHSFQLDDSHVLSSNPAIRNLANVGRYFVDPSTFTTLRANVDYRPVLQVTYALNYAISGYTMWSWHLVQILLHCVCVVGVYLLCRRVMTFEGVVDMRANEGGRDPRALAYVPLFAALLFAVHPTASGVVNYLSARSSLLTAALLFPSILSYLATDDERPRTPWLSAALYALALFTKVEAIACLAVYFLFDVWASARGTGHRRYFLGDVVATVNRRTLRRLWPFLVITAVYLMIRQTVMAPFDFEESRRGAGVSSLDYLLTQTVVWWRYVFNWFAPISLVADHGDYPVYRSLLAAPVALAVGGWLLVGAGLVAAWKSRPWLVVLAVSALALLSPTSSILPLAEMLNEHRPYMPMAVLSLCWLIPIGAWGARRIGGNAVLSSAAVGGLALILVGLGTLTWQRNRVFLTEQSYLEDVIAKEPSGRALNNYGLLFMRKGDYGSALQYFQQALKYTPNLHTVHINLGIVYARLRDTTRAEEHFAKAVEYERFSGSALTWRGEFFLERGRFAEAARDFEQARPKSLETYRLSKGLATAYAAVGDVARAVAATKECMELDSAQTAVDIVAMSAPFFSDSSLTNAGLRYFEQLDAAAPNTWWVHYNIGTLAARAGDKSRADAEHARGLGLRDAR